MRFALSLMGGRSLSVIKSVDLMFARASTGRSSCRNGISARGRLDIGM